MEMHAAFMYTAPSASENAVGPGFLLRAYRSVSPGRFNGCKKTPAPLHPYFWVLARILARIEASWLSLNVNQLWSKFSRHGNEAFNLLSLEPCQTRINAMFVHRDVAPLLGGAEVRALGAQGCLTCNQHSGSER